MSAVLYARVRDDVHEELRQVAELAEVSMATVVETVLALRFGLPITARGYPVTQAIAKRKADR